MFIVTDLQSHFPLGFNDNIYHEGNISKMPSFDVFLFWNVKQVKVDTLLTQTLLNKAIGIINFTKPFLNLIDDTMI